MRRIVDLTADHIDAAVNLVTTRARIARERLPLIPGALEDAARVRGLLETIVATGTGVAAVDGDVCSAFLSAFPGPLWGDEGAYVPEWGHAAPDRATLIDLYTAASKRWAGLDLVVQAVTLWADDVSGEEAWHHIGFGRVVVDTIRDLTPPESSFDGTVARASASDAAAVFAMEEALRAHVEAPPVSLIHDSLEGAGATAGRLEDPDRPVWVARRGSNPVGYLSFESYSGSPAGLAGDGVVYCDGAYVVPDERARGAGAALMAAAMTWAAGAGFTTCALDYESANTPADRFWRGIGCIPVLHSVARRLRPVTPSP